MLPLFRHPSELGAYVSHLLRTYETVNRWGLGEETKAIDVRNPRLGRRMRGRCGGINCGEYGRI